jgi:hypothetical protein
MTPDELLSVYWYDRDGNQHRDKYLQPFAECREAITRLTTGPAAALGIVQSIKATDSLDCLIVELKRTETGWRRTF